MYTISIVGDSLTPVYDQEHPDIYPVMDPQCSLEIGQPGSLKFSVLLSHPAYYDIRAMETYVTATRNGGEIFYGRVIDTETEKTTGVLQVTCAGALNFLDDVELAPMNNVSMTGEAFFRKCITDYNAGIGNDQKRAISVGTISHSRASQTLTFSSSSYQKIRQALESYLTREYGGYLRIRKSGNEHVIDWIEDFGIINVSPIELGENVVSQQNAITSADLFTMVRPTGKNGITLPEGTVPVTDELVTKYGRIIRSVKFNNATTVASLRTETQRYLDRIGKGLEKTCTVNLIDMHFLDGNEPSLALGAVYTQIKGFETEDMTTAAMELHFDHPGDDSVTLKNETALQGTKTGSAGGTTRGSGRGSTAQTFANMYKHISETEDMLGIHADTIELHGIRIEETATEFERYSTETTETIERYQNETNTSFNVIRGTATYQNADHISQVAGLYSIRYRQVPTSRLTPTRDPKASGYYQWENDHVATDEEVGNGTELFYVLQDALDGKALLNASRDNTVVIAGTIYGRMTKVTETEVIPDKKYYTRNIGTYAGTEVYLDEDGQEITVGTEIVTNRNNINEITGSALWTKRDDITGVVGEYEIHTDPQTGERTLVIKSGGGLKILRNGVEYGVYDDYTLSGGILVDKLNDGSTVTKISGDKINITTNSNFAQLVADENGLQTTVATHTSTLATHTSQIGGIQGTVDTFSGSALWTQRDAITGVCGEFDVITAGGVKTLRIKSGGGLKILRNSVEYGVYDSGNLTAGAIVDKVNNGSSKILGNKLDVNATQVAAWGAYTNSTLTGGILVQKINDGSTTTQILGSKVNITATQMASIGIYTDSHYDGGLMIDRINANTNKKIQGVRVSITAQQVLVGSTSNVQAWMDQTGTDIDTLEGAVMDKATIAQLDALDAKIETVKTDYLTVNKLASLNTVSVRSLNVGSSGNGGITVAKGNVTLYSGCDLRFAGSGSPPSYTSVKSAIRELQITQSGNTYTLQKRAFNESSWVNVGSFSRAVSSWVWGGGSGKINVTALPQNQTKSINISVDGTSPIRTNGTYTYTAYFENGDGDDVSTGATKTVSVEVETSVSSINWSCGNSMYTFTPDSLTSPKKTLGFTDSADIHIAVQTNGVPPTMTNTKWISAPLKIVQMQQSASPISRYTFNLSINATNAWNAGSAAYYNSSYWARPSSSNSWTAKIPDSTVSAAEDWFKLTELSIWSGGSKASSGTIYQSTTYTPYVKVGTDWMVGTSITISPPNVSIEDPEIYTDGPGYNTKVTGTQTIYDSSKKYMAKVKIGESTYNGTEITFTNGYPRSISLKHESSSQIGGGIYRHTFTYEGSASPVPAEVGESFKIHFNNSGT